MRPEDIPQDVWERAGKAAAPGGMQEAVARAILSERERCALIVEDWQSDLAQGEIIDAAIHRLAARVRDR